MNNIIEQLGDFYNKSINKIIEEHNKLQLELDKSTETIKALREENLNFKNRIKELVEEKKTKSSSTLWESTHKQLKEKEMAINDDSWRRMLAEDLHNYKKGKYTVIEIRAVSLMRWLEDSKQITIDTFTEEEYKLCKAKARKTIYFEQNLNKPMVERMSDRKRQLLKESISFEGMRELYKLYLSKQ
jgi:hypothetical protein